MQLAGVVREALDGARRCRLNARVHILKARLRILNMARDAVGRRPGGLRETLMQFVGAPFDALDDLAAHRLKTVAERRVMAGEALLHIRVARVDHRHELLAGGVEGVARGGGALVELNGDAVAGRGEMVAECVALDADNVMHAVAGRGEARGEAFAAAGDHAGDARAGLLKALRHVIAARAERIDEGLAGAAQAVVDLVDARGERLGDMGAGAGDAVCDFIPCRRELADDFRAARAELIEHRGAGVAESVGDLLALAAERGGDARAGLADAVGDACAGGLKLARERVMD